jgi:Ca-activated chloride channel family protein
MRLRTVVGLALLGIVASSAAALAIPLPWHGKPTLPVEAQPDPQTQRDLAHFTVGQTLTLDGRLGHATIAKSGRGETFLVAQVTGREAPGVSAPPLNLAIVVDRSGSMKGDRIANAVAAAVGMVERMRDGDSVTVVSFDTEATVVVPPTLASAGTRASIEAAIRSIRLGGDTCISCGLEEGMQQLDRTALGADRVNRMILLSDGATNHGVRDLPGLRAMAARMRERGAGVSTIGVDVDFDEKVMSAIAAEANGKHYFVESPSALPAIFSQEFDELLASVANDAEVTVDLAPGVEVDEVFDRTFRREGSRIVVPFGTFSAKQEKTVLVKLRVPADHDGVQPIADVTLAYRDLVRRDAGACDGQLALVVTSDPLAVQKDLDPVVATRVERSRTAQTLTEVNQLFADGKAGAALSLLNRQKANLEKTQALTHNAPPRPVSPRVARELDKDLAAQQEAVSRAAAAPSAAPASHAGKALRKENEARSLDLRK